MREHLRKTKNPKYLKTKLQPANTSKQNTESTFQRLYKRFPSKHIRWVLLVAFLGSAIYFQTYNYNYTQDDVIYTIENSATKKGIDGLADIFTHGSLFYYVLEPTNTGVYRPLTLFTFCIEFEVFRTFDPKNGHSINIILYFLVLVFAGLVLVRVFKTRKIPLPVPLLILALYALHPIHTEVVASVKGRETLLCALFVFLALYLWLRNVAKQSFLLKIAIGLIFFLGLLSKEEGITFVAVAFLISYIFLSKSIEGSLKEAIPFFIATVVFLLIRYIVLDQSIETYNSTLNNVIYSLQGPDRFATNLYVYLYYIWLLIFPFPLSIDYSYSQITPKTFSDIWVILSLLFFIFLLITSLKGFWRKTVIGFGILFYLCTFSVFSNLTEGITIGATIGERFMFLPSLGFCIVFVYSAYWLAKKMNYKLASSLLVIFLPISMIYAAKSYSRTKVWSDNITLFKSAIKTAPKSWRVHNNLAEAARSKAIRMENDTSASKPKVDSILYWNQLARKEYELAFDIIKGLNTAPYQSYLNYGELLFKLKDTTGAKSVFQKVTTLSLNPSAAWHNLGTIAFYERDFVSAVNYYQRALISNGPTYFSTYKYLGSSYLMLQDYNNAIKAYENALRYGKDAEITSNLSMLYANTGNLDKAISIGVNNGTGSAEEIKYKGLMNAGNIAFNQGKYREAINYLNKCESYYHQNGGYKAFPEYLVTLGRSYLKLNEMGDAKIIFNKVMKEDPRNFIALQNLGTIAYQYEKNYVKATEYFNMCLHANSPDLYFTYSSLGFLYWIQNMPDQAIQNFESALKYNYSKDIINNLYKLWSLKGNQEKVKYYQDLLNKQ